ncbi:MAG: hypothetical protein L0Z50_33265 [Verrucomicrobiales bacterium]|nr:hypothetical protein [Verrucomicrobiales bacterium]
MDQGFVGGRHGLLALSDHFFDRPHFPCNLPGKILLYMARRDSGEQSMRKPETAKQRPKSSRPREKIRAFFFVHQIFIFALPDCGA